MSKLLKFNEDVIKSIGRGIKALAKAVSVTLGPKGRNVMINRGFGAPLSTKDGASVAKEIVLKDGFENMGAQLLKEAAIKTAEVAGDGTTTAIVLAEAIYNEGAKSVAAGSNPFELKKGIDQARSTICLALDKMATPINTSAEIKQIATISANNDLEMGSFIAQALGKVGKDGVVTIAEAKGMETTLEVVEGLKFDQGYVSPYFMNQPEKMTAELEHAVILIVEKRLNSVKEAASFLEKIMEKGKRPLLIIAEDFDADVLTFLIVNKIKAGFSLCGVKAPKFGDLRKEIFKDIAILTGGTVVTEELGMTAETFDYLWLGQAKRIVVGKDYVIIAEGSGNSQEVKKRVEEIRAALSRTRVDYEKEQLKERLAKLSGGVAVINVGAATEAELKEKKGRFEDALDATHAAIAEGVVPGGGVAFLRASKAIEAMGLSGDQQIGVEIVRKALFFPAIIIANNCGKQGNLIAEKVFEKTGNIGFNGLTEEFSDLVKDGVIDPVFVTKTALINAASIAGILLTASVMITEKPKPKGKHSPMPDMGGMGDMDDMM